jgi:hypothetical protein
MAQVTLIRKEKEKKTEMMCKQVACTTQRCVGQSVIFREQQSMLHFWPTKSDMIQ